MDAHEPQFEETPPSRPTDENRPRRGLSLIARTFGLAKHLFLPLRSLGKSLKPVARVFSPLLDRGVRLPGAGLSWAIRHGKLVGIGAALVLLLSVPLLLRQIVISGIVPPPPPPTAQEALAALNSHDWPAAKRLAQSLQESDTLSEAEAGVPPFVLGMAALQDAEQYEGTKRKGFLTVASRYLEESQAKGFPAGFEQQGIYLLGKSLFESGQSAAARPVLEDALKLDPDHAKDYHSLLAQLYLRGVERDLERAKEHNSAVLNTTKLFTAERNEAWLRQCRIFFELDDIASCEDLMSKIPAEAKSRPETNSLRGRMLLKEARAQRTDAAAPPSPEAKAKYQQAIDAFRQTLGRGTTDSLFNREATYLIGVCLLALGDERAAADQFARGFKQFSDSDEGIASAFQYAELLRRLEKDDEAIAAFASLVKAAGPPDAFHNPWLTLNEVRDRLASDQQTYLLKQDFERAIRLADAATPIIPAERTVQLAAQGYRAWAQALQLQADKASGATVRDLQGQSREKLRLAGQRFAQLAELRLPTRFYPDDLWDSAQSAFAGRDYERAIRTVNQYLQVEPLRRRAQALLILGEAHLSLGNVTPALAALRECLESFPTDSASYRARVLMARGLTGERDHLKIEKDPDAESLADETETLLRENLNGDSLSPASLEYRDSLFALGKLQYERGLEQELFAARLRKDGALAAAAGDRTKAKQRIEEADRRDAVAHAQYEEAVTRLDEAVSRYPDSPTAMEGRYLMAESYRHAANEARERIHGEVVETARIAHSRQMQQMLSQAAAQYETLRDLLNRRQEHAELTPLEQIILRNAYFFHGASLFEAGRYEEAIRAYSTATNRYQDSPEVLEAYLQIASCYWRLNRLEEYQGTIEQAKVVLKGMPDDAHSAAAFQQVTNYSRAKWEERLNWLIGLRRPADPTREANLTARNP